MLSPLRSLDLTNLNNASFLVAPPTMNYTVSAKPPKKRGTAANSKDNVKKNKKGENESPK